MIKTFFRCSQINKKSALEPFLEKDFLEKSFEDQL